MFLWINSRYNFGFIRKEKDLVGQTKQSCLAIDNNNFKKQKTSTTIIGREIIDSALSPWLYLALFDDGTSHHPSYRSNLFPKWRLNDQFTTLYKIYILFSHVFLPNNSPRDKFLPSISRALIERPIPEGTHNLMQSPQHTSQKGF